MGKINVIGLGYIGLPTALMFAANGVEVVGTDYNEKIVESLNNGVLTFKEDGLEEIFKKAVKSGIKFTKEYIKTNKYIITVPTPYIRKTKQMDSTYVINAVESVLEICDKGTVLIIESTVSPGTIDKHIRPIIEEKGFNIGEDIHLVHAPERIIPGKMVQELVLNSRTIGVDNLQVGEEVKYWYKSFCKGDIVITDIKTAELSKVIENTYRDVNIAFANELAKICRREGIDVYELIDVANKHPRVNILQPGPGVGGHCISVDPWFLVGDYPDIVNVILGARNVNDTMPDYIIERLAEIMKKNNISDLSKVGFYGLTYKENVDDIRESPTLQIIDKLKKYFANGYKVYDPYIKEMIVEGQVLDLNEFINSVELVVVMVNHDEIKANSYILKDKIIFDTRNCIVTNNDIDKTKVYGL